MTILLKCWCFIGGFWDLHLHFLGWWPHMSTT